MRIIAGHHRGRRLAAPRTDAIRPTTDRIRESLFSIVGDLHDAVVVDGYAGTGALGCEAISRGARRVFFFDPAREAITLISDNVSRVDGADRAVITRGRFTDRIELVDEPIDVVFLDPPYGSSEISSALATLATCDVVDRDTLIVVEQDARDEPPAHDAFDVIDDRRYGGTRLLFLRRTDP